MSKPKSLSEAIRQLDDANPLKNKAFKDILEQDYLEVKKAVEDLKPHLDRIRHRVDDEVREAKHHVEAKVHESPWLALGIAGLIGLFIGWLMGHRRH